MAVAALAQAVSSSESVDNQLSGNTFPVALGDFCVFRVPTSSLRQVADVDRRTMSSGSRTKQAVSTRSDACAAQENGKAAHVLGMRTPENPRRIQCEHVEEPGAGAAAHTLCALRGGRRSLTLSGLWETQSCTFLLCEYLETQR